jgi:hypothetical protein
VPDLPSVGSLVISETELAEIGDGFKTCLTKKISVARRGLSKLPQHPPQQGSETTDCPQENSGH